jgi:hypothetical protein
MNMKFRWCAREGNNSQTEVVSGQKSQHRRRLHLLSANDWQKLGTTTLLYIQLEQALFKEESSEFHVKTTSDPEEIKSLLEVGFEYICSKDGLMFFRKRK